MKNALPATWAATPSSQRREPTVAEVANGFACGPADVTLFNELMYRASGMEAELKAILTDAGITPSAADLTQVLQAIRKLTGISARSKWITTTQNFTVPDGITTVEAICIGGGGGGSASGNGSAGGIAGNSGAGGGGGGFAWKSITGLTPGAVIVCTIGAGGAAGNVGVNGGNGQSGGTTSFGAHVSATGGGGATWGENTLAAGGTGGNGSGGTVNIQGTDGGIGGPNVALGSSSTMSDTHRIYNRGGIAAGGLSVPVFGGTAAAGRGFGSGGGGATGGSGLSGGAGSSGLIILHW